MIMSPWMTRPEMSLIELARRVYQFIFEEEKVSREDVHKMQQGMVDWHNYIQDQKNRVIVLPGTTLDDDNEVKLMYLGTALKRKEEGEYDFFIKTYKENHIDWRKTLGDLFPESRTAKDYADAKAAHEKLKQENPEENPV